MTRDSGSFSFSSEDVKLLEALSRKDESAFTGWVRRESPALLRLARVFVASEATAEELVQETWLAVLEGLPQFQRRSSLRTWVSHILVNRARSRGAREARWDLSVDLDTPSPAVDPTRFDERERWVRPPEAMHESPESAALNQELFQELQRALTLLPPAQKAVVTLRDVEGWSSEEVCNVLGLSETNQRVLLHRGRSKVRAALEPYWKK